TPPAPTHAPPDTAPFPDLTCPENANWYTAASYCNWLSEREDIPARQWCYETNSRGEVTQLKEKYLSLTGYRLPSEAEWEYACRAGSLTKRYYGQTDDLLPKYGWYKKNSADRMWPVGSLKPNDFGLFDVHGNAFNWCQERAKPYPKAPPEKVIEDREDDTAVRSESARILRGGSYLYNETYVFSSYRHHYRPGTLSFGLSFRVARTLAPD